MGIITKLFEFVCMLSLHGSNTHIKLDSRILFYIMPRLNQESQYLDFKDNKI
ncbi:hypothetical protein [Helicobacter bilis]|uniref:hypothetical protein n=1 Tax=Helicobacter bilis TaxID=37372 RepID=UPI0012DAFE77|nr:hypothetical protein [Helicobacter bilis]